MVDMTKKMQVTTLEDLKEMTLEERNAAERASIVRDPSALPPGYLDRVQQRMADQAERDRTS